MCPTLLITSESQEDVFFMLYSHIFFGSSALKVSTLATFYVEFKVIEISGKYCTHSYNLRFQI